MDELALIIFGLSTAALYGLIVIGIVLTYRMSRVLNLAHGAIAMTITYVFWQLAVGWGWSRWLSLAVALGVVAPAVGVVIAVLFRSLLTRDDTAKIAGTVALIVILFETVQLIWEGRAFGLPALLPRSAFQLGGARLGVDRLLTIGIAVAAGAAIAFGLARTRLGTEMRAVAESRSQAALSGIDVWRVETLGWVGASVLAGGAGILISSLGSLNPTTLTFVVLNGLAAAAFGRLVSVGWSLVGVAILGVAQAEVARLPTGFTARYGSLSAALPFVLLVLSLVVLVARKADLGGGDTDQLVRPGLRGGVRPTGTLDFGRHVRLAGCRLKGSRPLRRLLGPLGCVLGVLVVSRGNPATLFDATLIAAWVVAFASLMVLNGLGGQVSLCQAAFMGIGALVAAKVQTSCSTSVITGRSLCVSAPGLRVWVGLALAALVPALIGFLLAAGATRIRGVMLAILTLAFGFFLDSTVFVSQDLAGGELGYPMSRPPGFTSPKGYWILSAVIAGAAVVAIRNLARSASGRALRMLEQSPTASTAFGTVGWSFKSAVFALAAAGAGTAGFLYSTALGNFTGANFNAFVSMMLFLVLSSVGTRRLVGVVVAAAAFVYAPDVLGRNSNLVVAFIAFLTLSVPGGVVGQGHRVWESARGRVRAAALAGRREAAVGRHRDAPPPPDPARLASTRAGGTSDP